jgi:hypothetical protein
VSFLGVVASVILLMCGAGCTGASDEPASLPFGAAEQIRELHFTTRPRVIKRTHDEYAATEAQKGLATTDRAAEESFAVWGRLGFYPPGYDIRKAAGSQAPFVGAFYDPREKAITVFDVPTPSEDIVVHELVHALQDETFGIDRYYQAVTTLDELMAREAVVEGDATLCAQRLGSALQSVSATYAWDSVANTSRQFIDGFTEPPIFAAYMGFAYSFGTAFVARRAGVFDTPAFWSREHVDRAFTDAAPASTAEILRTASALAPLPRVEVGLAELPPGLASRYELRTVDRLGAWYTYLLLRSGSSKANESSINDVLPWTGDQLVVLGGRELSVTSTRKPPNAVVWTSAWESDDAAQRVFAGVLATHTATPQSSSPHLYRASDQELMWLERRGKRVVLVKGPPQDDLGVFAEAALTNETPHTARLAGVRALTAPVRRR